MYTLLLVLALVSAGQGHPQHPNTHKGGSKFPGTYKGPVIGVLAQKTYDKWRRYGNSYIAASYVKYLQGAGAQVVPVLDSLSQDELNRTLHSLNGILIPGGAQSFPDSKFYETSKYIYDWTTEHNKKGLYFPLWGTCLGFEAILYAESKSNATQDLRFRCSAHMANNLTVEEGAQDSKLLKNIDSKLYEAMQRENNVYNAHAWCVGREHIDDPTGSLHKNFNLLASNWDAKGHEYVALVEHKTLPIYASQFHPEKNGFEWSVYSDIPHSRNAISLMQYFANFLVEEAGKNGNSFPEAARFYKGSIENYGSINTLLEFNSTLQSCFFFHDERNDVEVDTSDIAFW